MRRPLRLGARALLLAATAALAVPAGASAHLERATYWPDPAADTAVTPPAGGAFPKARSLSSAVHGRDRTRLRVVCKPDSLRLAYASIRSARASGYEIRPSQGRLRLSRKLATRLKALNKALFRRCRFRDIQEAVWRSGNNGRVVVMPGTYTEGPSRAQRTDDPACDAYENQDGSLSYRYHVTCPNDANLIYVQGRELGSPPPDPARPDRHGIPDAGPCLRCNLQVEGSGVGPDDVVITAAEDPATPLRQVPEKYAKDVVLRVDRADGFVIRNITVAHAQEHGIYVTETDGYLIDRVRMFWNRAYGALMFTSDHGIVQDSDGSGSGDSAVYPGAAPDTGEQTVEPAPRINTILRRNDFHRNAIGCSCAAMGNAMLIEDNDAYDNGTGISADSLGAGGHPGYPQDSSRIVGNRIYSNNFNIYAADSDVPPTYFTVVGVGLALWGGNNNLYEANRIWDNWRYGAMLFALPTDWAGYYFEGDPVVGQSTSYNNRYTRNVMGIAPDGSAKPNGLDFWWDAFPGTTGNRWCNNIGAGGTITSDPGDLPDCQGPSVGLGDPDNQAEFTTCGLLLLAGAIGDPSCEWWSSPPPPSRAARSRSAAPEAWTGDPRRQLRGLLGDTYSAGVRVAVGPAQLRKADCGDWLAAPARDRQTLVRTLAMFYGENLPAGSPVQTLPAQDAHDLFGNLCSHSRANDLFLWGIYVQAAGFGGYQRAYAAALRRFETPAREGKG